MTQYDQELTDEEWRELNFPQDVIHGAARMGTVASASKLIEYARKYGEDGILESAIMLGQSGYRQVEEALKKMTPARAPRRRRAA